jgi:hypothetical protein
MRRRYDHIDLRVRSLAEARPFYETLLPALGLTRNVRMSTGSSSKQPARTVRVIFLASPSHQDTANECRIAFWADSPSEVDRLAEIMRKKGVSETLSARVETARWSSIHDASFGNLPPLRDTGRLAFSMFSA